MPWEGGKKAWQDELFVLETPEGQWRQAGRLPRPLGYGVSASFRGELICVGGSDATRHYADAFRLRWSEGRLAAESLPSLPIALANMSGTLVAGELYVACGVEGPGEDRATRRAFVLGLEAREPTWREIEPLPGVPRLLATAASHHGAFYVLGGVALESEGQGKSKRAYLRDAYCYRKEQGWSRIADLPEPNAAAPSPAPVVNSHILLLSGDDGSGAGFKSLEKHPGFVKTVSSFDTSVRQWSSAGDVPCSRVTTPCVEWRGRFVVASGEVRPGVRSPEVWSFVNTR
jgi:N-acetylneuraminic acid mutarotase